MTPAPTTISIDTTVARLQQMMAENRLRWFPVVTGSEVVGIVTDRDIASCYGAAETTVGAIMTREVITISPRTSMQEAARQLLESDIDGLPVVDNRKLVGIVTRSDILKVFAEVESGPHILLRRVLGRTNP
jgi:CIC family chloride channel protein